MTRRFNHWLLVWIVVLMVPFWWLLMANDGGGGPAKPVHIADLRKLAATIAGQRPTAVTATLLARRLAVGDYLAGGVGLRRRPIGAISWTLPVADRAPIVIDPGLPPVQAGLGNFTRIDTGKLSQTNAQARRASLVLYTQGPAPGTGAGTAAVRLVVTIAQAVAPGVVVIPTTSHAPNSRLIFVALTDGREFLFTGDVAVLAQNWAQLRIRSHLAALLGPPQNSDQTYAWLRTIRQLQGEAPRLHIVPGHDLLWLTRELTQTTDLKPAPPPVKPQRGALPHDVTRRP